MPEYIPTPEQQRILGHRPGRHARILAGPGTGKSATLVALMNELLQEVPRPRIRLLTFTRAATAELAKRVSEHPAAAAERPSTIHSFAISILLSNLGSGDFPEPLRIADDWEDENIVLPTLARRAGVKVRRLKKLIRELSSNWESLREDEVPGIDPAERALFTGAWGEHREVFGYTLLAELPYRLMMALNDYPGLVGIDYDLLVVDEYQDLNACDLEVLRLVAARGCSIIGAGDDDQSIYSLRKAAPEGIRRFLEDYEGAIDYPLSVTQRCGSTIVDWANYVIEGDPGRPRDRPRLAPCADSPTGEVALLSFADQAVEAEGVAQLVHKLINVEGIPAKEILILLRGDYLGIFSQPIKAELDILEIPYSDPDAVKRVLAEPANRRIIEIFRLLDNPEDSLAWAALLKLERGIGDVFIDRIYQRARRDRTRFGLALLGAFEEGFPDGPAAPAGRASRLVEETLSWIDSHRGIRDSADPVWGQIILDAAADGLPAPTQEFIELLHSLDELIEFEQGLGTYLNQIAPLGRDIALAESSGVRIMTMGGAKGLTVEAAIISALETGIIPRPETDLGEERRLLYVAMTRAKQYVYGTWAQCRFGPTARSGETRVGMLRRHSYFLDGGPVRSQDGPNYIEERWP